MKLSATIANAAWLASSLQTLNSFRRALHHPERTQLSLLRGYLSANADSAYGKAHHFSEISTYEEFSRRVPLASYEDLEPFIFRIMRGEERVLTSEPVIRLVPTSGSTGARKLIPFTAGLQGEFDRAIGPWISDLYLRNPSAGLGPAYWSITPVFENQAGESSSVPIGFDDDSSYLGGMKKRLVDTLMAVPSELRNIREIEVFRYVTLLCLLRQRDLSLISVWHPSFMLLLLDALPAHWENLLEDIHTGGCRPALPKKVLTAIGMRPMPRRANELKNASPLNLATLWPFLSVISCWGDGHAEISKTDLAQHFPGICVQPKGLLATEACVTIPFDGEHPCAVRSHFFEFLDESGVIKLAHELTEGSRYEVVVTTAGGLWRYRLRDIIQVTGFLGRTPTLSFLERTGNVSDRFGEKLSEGHVIQAIREATAGTTQPLRFALLAPDEDSDGCGYTFYIEGDVKTGLASQLEQSLRKNPHYDWCRQLGQLKPLRIFRIQTGGYETFAARETFHSRRLGEIKPCALSVRFGWSEHFKGRYLAQDRANTQERAIANAAKL